METLKHEPLRPLGTEEMHPPVLTPARFAASYHMYVTPLCRYFSQHTGNAADAEDLTAATISKALASLHSYAGRGTLAAWLFGIARHTLHDFQQRRGNTVTLDAMAASLADATPLPEQSVVAQERWDDLHAHIRALPANQREALTLRYFGGLPIAAIAVVLDRSEGAVKLLIHRALTTLRTQYRQEEQQ
ncbi:MAG: RNA polymerase sigma factor [Thermomicrobiales bacterium]